MLGHIAVFLQAPTAMSFRAEDTTLQLQDEEPQPGWSGLYDPWNGRRRVETPFDMFPVEELIYNTEDSDYEEDIPTPLQREEEEEDEGGEVLLRSPSPVRRLSPLRRDLYTIEQEDEDNEDEEENNEEEDNEDEEENNEGEEDNEENNEDEEDNEEEAARLRSPSPVRNPSPSSRRSPGRSQARSSPQPSTFNIEVDTRSFILGMPFVYAYERIPAQGLRRWRDEEDDDPEGPSTSRQVTVPDDEADMDYFLRPINIDASMVPIFMREL